jgi:hypothetical protein
VRKRFYQVLLTVRFLVGPDKFWEFSENKKKFQVDFTRENQRLSLSSLPPTDSLDNDEPSALGLSKSTLQASLYQKDRYLAGLTRSKIVIKHCFRL